MLDVFLTTVAKPDRVLLAAHTIRWWVAEAAAGRVRLTVIDGGANARLWTHLELSGLKLDEFEIVKIPREGSQRERHLTASRLATTDPFLSVDDDITPHPALHVHDSGVPTPTWPDYVRWIFADRPKLAMACPLPTPGGLDPRVSDAFLGRAVAMGEITAQQRAQIRAALRLPTTDEHFWPVSSCGGIRVLRAGVLTKDAPPLDPAMLGGWDTTVGRWLDGFGWELGYLTRWGATHHGYHCSETWGSPA